MTPKEIHDRSGGSSRPVGDPRGGLDTLCRLLATAATREEAQGFYDEYAKGRDDPAAEVGYWLGYQEADARIRVSEWLGIEHPVFGDLVLNDQQLFESGKMVARFMEEGYSLREAQRRTRVALREMLAAERSE